MFTLIIIAVVIIAVVKPSILMSAVFWIAAPFLAIWGIIKGVQLLNEAVRHAIWEWRLNRQSRSTSINLSNIKLNLFNKNTVTYNEGSHNQYDNSVRPIHIENKQIRQSFAQSIDPQAFQEIVKTCGKKYKRLSEIRCEGYDVFGSVTSQSKLSEWQFHIVFDGQSTDARYSITAENDDSTLPSRLATDIHNTIRLQMLDNKKWMFQ